MDFFDGVGIKPDDDIYAWHYFSEQKAWETERDKVARPALYDEYRQAANKLAVHLTYSRVEYAASRDLSPSMEVTEYLMGLAALFLRLLTPERAAWFGGLLL